MKCTIEIDCTPAEARQFFGLPDLQPMQTRLMADMEAKMLAELERYSPENALKTWMTTFSQTPEQLQQALTSMMLGRTGTSGR